MRPPTTLSLLTPFRLLLTAILGLCLSSCVSPRFQRAWNQAATQPPQADPFCGQWQGTWQSQANHHHGKLRCVVSPPQSPGQDHQFYYHATWMRFLSGGYRTKHTLTPSSKSTWTLAGQHQMPDWAGGLYTYKGQLSPSNFTTTYQCELDHGTFTLSRPLTPLKKKLAKSPAAQ